MSRSIAQPLLMGEWACLGILATGRAHGFAVAARLKPTGDVGRVWSMSRPLTYRALDQLAAQGLIRPVGEEPGIAGGNRTVLAITPRGRARLDRWLASPVHHLRDLRSELLLKLVLTELRGKNPTPLLGRQHDVVTHLAATFDDQVAVAPATDVVLLWRAESARAAVNFIDTLLDTLLDTLPAPSSPSSGAAPSRPPRRNGPRSAVGTGGTKRPQMPVTGYAPSGR